MRKLLMATAAVVVVGASLGIAQAAEVAVVNPSLPTQPTPPATPATPALSSGYKPPLSSTLAPGQIVVRMELQFNNYFASGWSSTQNVAGDKMQPYGLLGYPRFYFGFDAQATNGLLYGTYFQIRDNNGTAAASSTAGNAGASGDSTNNTLFFRNEYGYIGTAQLGILRIGSSAGPMGNMLTATFDDIATGGWNGDINDWENGGSYGLSGSFPNWPFFDVGAEYTTNKFVYLTPKYWGVLDGAFSYEPSTATPADTQQCNNPTAAPITGLTETGFTNCNNQSTSTAANDLQRRRNTIEAGIRFGDTFNGWGINGSIIGAYGGHLHPGPGNAGVGGTTYENIQGNIVTLHPTNQFENIAIGYGGLGITFAGVTVGGSVIGGQYNGQMAALPRGGREFDRLYRRRRVQLGAVPDWRRLVHLDISGLLDAAGWAEGFGSSDGLLI